MASGQKSASLHILHLSIPKMLPEPESYSQSPPCPPRLLVPLRGAFRPRARRPLTSESTCSPSLKVLSMLQGRARERDADLTALETLGPSLLPFSGIMSLPLFFPLRGFSPFPSFTKTGDAPTPSPSCFQQVRNPEPWQPLLLGRGQGTQGRRPNPPLSSWSPRPSGNLLGVCVFIQRFRAKGLSMAWVLLPEAEGDTRQRSGHGCRVDGTPGPGMLGVMLCSGMASPPFGFEWPPPGPPPPSTSSWFTWLAGGGHCFT